ncbi:MAG: hypothetical protein LBL59_02185 [Xanthomonadaceae bacterium]|jgi:hypothetical protein|nr:hypothetical protein [Xanthomonadaceae bacterium]
MHDAGGRRRSPHCLSSQPPAQRTREDERVLERLSPQATFAYPRERTPDHFSDAMVLETRRRAHEAGIDTPDRIGSYVIVGDKVSIMGERIEQRAMMGLIQPVPP